MECHLDLEDYSGSGTPASRGVRSMKHVGISLYDGFALPDAAQIMEVFQSANALLKDARTVEANYDVRLLSAAGGRIASSSSVFVSTESVEAYRGDDCFHALFIVGGAGLRNALSNERLIRWLRRACPNSGLIFPVGDGRLLVEATGFVPASVDHGYSNLIRGETLGHLVAGHRSNGVSPLRGALSVVEEDFGVDLARQIADRMAPPTETRFTAIVRRNASIHISEPIQASARWLEANGDRSIAINDAARVAAMSERNFLRRFKAEMGVTPSDYLLYVRLDMCCRLLADTDLPVDKIARRCGSGSGGQLSKLFRKHLDVTPTEYRASKRPSCESPRSHKECAFE